MISLSALTFFRLIQFYSDTHVRLTGHNTTFAGRVEVFSHGVWGRVTDSWSHQWRKKEADVVCRQLGFPGAITAVRNSAFGEGSGPVVMSGVQCLGTENTLQQCQFHNWIKSSINTGQEVGVICKTHDFHPDNSGIQIRLQGSTLPNAGRVEVLYAGVWGAISSSSWDMNDAMVVCRQLGYSAGAEKALKNGVYGLVGGPVWVTNLQCTGSESNVMDCVQDVLGNQTELQSRSYSAVICKDTSFSNGMTVRLRGSHSPNMGRVEVHYAGIWGSIYYSGWDIRDATVACRQLGYSTASLSGDTLFCSADVPHWFTNFQCNGNETSLDQCARDFKTFYSYAYCANVVCTDKTTNAGSELRLRGSLVPHAGRVEVRYKGVWGTIYYFDYHYLRLLPEATRVICRQLGFTDSILSYGWSVFGPGEGPQWFTSYDLHCLGNEINVMNCSYSQPQFTIMNHRYDANVVCKPNVSQTNEIQVRLTGSSLPFAGTIEVLYYGVWGWILGYHVDIRVGNVICRQLGYSGADQVFTKPAFGRVRGPLWIYDIQCNGNETEIVHCTLTTTDKLSWHYHRYWGLDNAAAVLCNGANYSSFKALNVRLVGAPIANAGRVEVFYAGAWGTIEGWNWDINDAHVICRQLGYPGAISYGGYSNQFGVGNGPQWFTNVRCLGNESSFEECPKRLSGYPNPSISYVATALCKLPSQAAPSQDCSNIKCLSNGTCINTAFGPICNCTDGFTGPHCEIETFEQCKSSPCENGGHCFSDGSSFLCNCPKGLTGQQCKERILVASNPCQSHPCSNKSSCYHNKTHYTCVSNTEGSSKTNVKSTPIKEKEVTNTYVIVGLSVCAMLVVVLAAVNGYLILKTRQLTKRQANNPRAVFSNRAYRADSENQLDDVPADDVDLGTMATHGVMSPKPAIYEDLSRPLPPIPPQQTRRTEVPRSTAMQTNGTGIYDNGSATEQAERHYMGLSAKTGTTARPHVTEPGNNYMSLSPETPEAIAYSALNSALPKMPGRKQHGNNGRKRHERHKM